MIIARYRDRSIFVSKKLKANQKISKLILQSYLQLIAYSYPQSLNVIPCLPTLFVSEIDMHVQHVAEEDRYIRRK